MNRLKNDKRGFTLMETMLSAALGAMLIFAAIVSPLQLLRQARKYSEVTEYRQSIQTVALILKADLKNAKGDIRYDGEYLMVKDKAYLFSPDGVFREYKGNSQKLTDLFFELTLYDKALSLSESSEEDSLVLYFNYEYSSFEAWEVPRE